jgi:hypothetical protein
MALGVELSRCTDAMITDDTSDVLLVELSTSSYMVASSIINMLRDNTPLND